MVSVVSSSSEVAKKVWNALKEVYDPETGLSMVDMNLITRVVVLQDLVEVEFTPSSPFCPIAFYLAQQIKNAAANASGMKVKVICKGHLMEEQINRFINENLESKGA